MGSDSRRMTLVPGKIIADRFELLRPLGKGTMGSLWVAHHKTLEVEVALKFIDPELVDQPDLRSRFAQEATAAAKIRSPHVVSVLDFGQAEGNQPYIAMELLRGESLSDRLERVGRLSTADTVRVVIHTCKGLARAHGQGIIHRDMKPENLFICEDEEDEGFVVKVLDFGIAKAAAPTDGVLHRTVTGQLVGTPLYMSPEQALGHPATFKSDLYSVASVAYHCLTGRPVFDVENIALLLVHLATREPPPLSKHVPDAPNELEAWFQRALHKDPANRFDSARELAETFAQTCKSTGTARVSAISLPPPDTRTSDSWDDAQLPADAVLAAHEAVRIPPAPGAGDTLMDGAISGVCSDTPAQPEPTAERVRIVDPSREAMLPDADDPRVMELAPTVRDKSGALRDMVERVVSEPPVKAERPLMNVMPPERAAARSKPEPRPQSEAVNTILWILGTVVAISIAVAIGWFIGRTL